MGHFGFSYVGWVYLLMLFVPNGIWTKNRPVGYAAVADKESTLLLSFERVGQAGVTFCALAFRDFNPSPFTPWSVWLIVSFVFMLLYEVCWIRYFMGERTLQNFYSSFPGIPLPLAVLPVVAFLLLGIYGKVWWMIASVVLLRMTQGIPCVLSILSSNLIKFL